MRTLPIHMRHQPRPLGIFSHPVHIRRFQLHARPRLDQLLETSLPSRFERPRYLYKVDVGFPVVDENALVSAPFFVYHVGRMSIVVIVRAQGGVEIVGQPTLVKAQGREGAFDFGMSFPLASERALHFLRDVFFGQGGLFVVGQADDAVVFDGELEESLVVERFVFIGLRVVDLKSVSDEGLDEVGVALSRLEVGIEDLGVSLVVDPVDRHGPVVVVDHSVLDLAASVGIEKVEQAHVVHAAAIAVLIHLAVAPVAMGQRTGHHLLGRAPLETGGHAVLVGGGGRQVAKDGVEGGALQHDELVVEDAAGHARVVEGVEAARGEGQHVRRQVAVGVVGQVVY